VVTDPTLDELRVSSNAPSSAASGTGRVDAPDRGAAHLPKIGQRAKRVVWNQLLTPLRAEVIDELRLYFGQARTGAALPRCKDLNERLLCGEGAFSGRLKGLYQM
jgi:hypothetical protein